MLAAVTLIGVPTDVAAEGVCDRETEIAAGRNVICGHVHLALPPMVLPNKFAIVKPRLPPSRNVICGDVHRGVGADHSYPAPVAVVDLKGRVAAGSEIAREIEVEAGAPADGASAVEDLGIKSADR